MAFASFKDNNQTTMQLQSTYPFQLPYRLFLAIVYSPLSALVTLQIAQHDIMSHFFVIGP